MNYLFLLLLFSYGFTVFANDVNKIKEITFNTTNSITIKGEINDDVASRFVHELNQKRDKQNREKNGFGLFCRFFGKNLSTRFF